MGSGGVGQAQLFQVRKFIGGRARGQGRRKGA